MKAGLLCSLFLLFIGGTAFAQARPKQYKAALCGTAVLRDVDDKYNVNISNLEMPDPDGAAGQEELNTLKRKIAQQFPRKSDPVKKKTTTALAPVVGTNFVADSVPGIPPDNYMAINNSNRAVSVINSNITVHDATTGAYITRKGLKSFSTAVGLNSLLNDYRYDPKVVYDPEADRFICVMLNATNAHNWIVMGFSQSNDPSAGWNFYRFYGDYTGDTTWFDYPAISVTHNEFFLTGNKIKYDSSWQAGFTRSLIYQVRKQDGYNGDSVLSYQIWDSVTYAGKYIRCLYPLNPGSALQGPQQYFLSDRNFDLLNDTVFVIKVPDPIGAGGTLTVDPVVSNLFYGAPPDGRQPDTSLSLATNDGRILGGFIEGSEIQFVCTSVNPLNGSSSVYHGVISNYATTPTLTGRMFSIDSLDLGYPNISYAGTSGGPAQSIISFNYSGPRTFPGFGAIFFDGSSLSDMVTVRSGDSTINMLAQKEQRWGDYSGSQQQWNAIGVVWAEGIFGKKNRQYGNYMAEFKSPYFTAVPQQAAPKLTSRLYPNPAWEFVSFEFSVSVDQVIDFVICDMQGRVVDKMPGQYCRDGKNLIQFNIAPLAPGTYFLKGYGTSGDRIETHTFVRK